jgi:hypothetical protein
MEKWIFPPPLGHPSSDSPAVNANPCPSVTGIASNRQNYIQIASPFSRAIRKSFRMAITWKIGFFHRRSVTRRPIHPRSTPIYACHIFCRRFVADRIDMVAKP